MKRFRLFSLILPVLFLFVASSSARAAEVTDGSKVKIAYSLTVDGAIVDQTTEEHPFEFTQGTNEIIPSLQEEIAGMSAGESKTVTLPPEKAFGPVNPEAIVEVPRKNLPEGDIQIGMVLTTTSPDGQVLRALVKEVKDDSAVIDFNHPLAGKEVVFTVKVLDVA